MMKYLLICQCFYLMYLSINVDAGKQGCQDDVYVCDNQNIIGSVQFCNGQDDCGDNSDENEENCQTPLTVELTSGDLTYGLVEIANFGDWGYLWLSEFTEKDAEVICRMLGYNGPSSVLPGNKFPNVLYRTWLGGLNCTGFENSIDECDQLIEAGVDCEGYEPAAVTCTPGHTFCGRGSYLAVGEKYETDDPFIETFTRIDDHDNNLLSRSGRKISKVSNPRNRRIVEGKMADSLKNFPWIADLSLNPNSQRFKNMPQIIHLCGAAIISEYFVLTAAHCVDWLKEFFPKSLRKAILRVTVGEYHQLKKELFETMFEVDDMVMHENYTASLKYINDIAILKLKAKSGHGIHFNKHVQPVCLPSPNTPLIDESLAVAGGWGISQTEHDMPKGRGSKYLHIGEVPVLSYALCDKYSKYRRKLSAGHLCAGHIKNGTDTCGGDSGGPLVQNINGRFTLLGLTSYGATDCGRANWPSVYANVKYYLPWILQNMKEMKHKST